MAERLTIEAALIDTGYNEIIARLTAGSEVVGDCWIFTANGADRAGYVRTHYEGRDQYVHRIAYRALIGPVEGTVDHQCHNEAAAAGLCDGSACAHRRCWNPAHLIDRSQGDNTLASPTSVAGRNARKTHCKNGHEFTPENTDVLTQTIRGRLYTRRRCRQCRRDRGELSR